MTEVLKALRDLNVSWKKNGHYNIKCRYLPVCVDGEGIVETESAERETTVVKFEMQVKKKTSAFHY